MDETQLQLIAQQLRKPDGEHGVMVGNMMNEGNLLINRYALQELNVIPGDNILELGMGNGGFIKDIVSIDSSVQYTGCDYSGTMIAEATVRNKEWVEKGQVHILQAAANDLPLADNIFDKAFGVNIIYFWDNPGIELAEIRRVLKPGGKLIIGIRPKKAMMQMPFTKFGFTMYSTEELTNLLEDNGFAVTNVVEKEEPAQQVNGVEIKPETVIVTAVK